MRGSKPIILAAGAFLLLLTLAAFFGVRHVSARAGGGGTSSGSSSGDWGSSIDWSSDGSSSDDFGGGSATAIIVVVVIVAFTIASYFAPKRAKLPDKYLPVGDIGKERMLSPEERTALIGRVNEVFYSFQKAWGEYDTATMQGLLTDGYYRRMVLEMNVMYSLKRQNVMDKVSLDSVSIGSYFDERPGWPAKFTAEIRAKADDTLYDKAEETILSFNDAHFAEYWMFIKEGGVWKLDLIRQFTESTKFMEGPVAGFAERNGFYYDPDFGRLMMPNKGAIFSKTDFNKSDINNHVVGFFRDKIVEFYTYRPDISQPSLPNYLVAQAILPISYRDIWVAKRSFMARCPKGLREMSLEWPDFNKKFLVCADPLDQISSLELLTPNFMEKIHALPFELNIEVVGCVLYFYTKKRDVSYDDMLQVLSWAFDEMKR